MPLTSLCDLLLLFVYFQVERRPEAEHKLTIMADESEANKGLETLKNFERALGHVRNSVRPLTQMSRDEVGACISPADRAKLNLQVAYGVTSLFYMFLRTQGVSPATHPVKAELDRIRGYFNRLKNVGKPPEQRTMKVDAAATRRFIDNALAGDRTWQNAKTTDSKEAQRRRAGAGIGRSLPAGQPENRTSPTAWIPRENPPVTSGKRKQQTPAVTTGARSSSSGSNRVAAPSKGRAENWDRAKALADDAEPEGAAAVAAAAAEECPRVSKRAKSCGKNGGKKRGERYHISK